MMLLNMLAFIGPVLVVWSYFMACTTNKENKEIAKFPRWIYLLSIPLSFVGFGSMFAYTMVWSPLFVIPIFMIPGLAISLGQIMKVRDNELRVIQNTWFTGKTASGSSLRLFSRGGLVPLLHGEVFRESFEERVVERELLIDNVETKDNTPVDVEIVFWIKPDFSRVQEMLETNQDPTKWWDTVFISANKIINKRASDVLKKQESGEAVRSKQKMSTKLKSKKTSSKKRFFKEEEEMGFIITDMIFSDINWTQKVREAQEQIQKSEALADAVNKLAKKTGIDLESLPDGPDKERRVREFIKTIQTQAGKRDAVDKTYKVEVDGINLSEVVSDIATSIIKKLTEKEI